ncbi:MAG TPA: endonuclease/exonuclease/phosphatase family protein [Polyangiaceae bacterium]|nr:endonuclease/exonuclease/phosphatase family protein [Polyangiaceae bacterium]
MAFTIATYNVKDLFDARDEASALHLNRKLDVLAGVIDTLDADVLALQEVSSEAVVDALRARLRPPAGSRGGYSTRIVGTADARGICCALLAREGVRSAEVHTAEQLDFPRFYETDPSPFGARIPLRRGIVRAEIDAGDLGVIQVLVLHLKSARPLPLRRANGEEVDPKTARERAEGELRTMAWRASEALFVRGLVDELCAKQPAHGPAGVVVTGDFNDVPGSTTLRIVSGDGETGLHSAIEDGNFSVIHKGAKHQIDHMLVSAGLHAKIRTARFFNEGLRDHSLLEDRDLPTPDSDHAPLVVRFG